MDLPLHLVNIKTPEKTFTLIQDSVLPAGTKQRAIQFFFDLKERGYQEVITYGTALGYGQVALALGCELAGLTATLFVSEIKPRTPYTIQALSYGLHLIEIPAYTSLTKLSRMAEEYASTRPLAKFLKLGLDDPEYIEALAKSIASVSKDISPKRIWVAGGSGTLARALAKAFPNTIIAIVQVGTQIWPDVLAQIPKYELYVAPEKFTEAAKVIPPYQSLIHYDAKIWRFVLKYGEDGDFIWNVK